jgi:hypothetical protein
MSDFWRKGPLLSHTPIRRKRETVYFPAHQRNRRKKSSTSNGNPRRGIPTPIHCIGISAAARKTLSSSFPSVFRGASCCCLRVERRSQIDEL